MALKNHVPCIAQGSPRRHSELPLRYSLGARAPALPIARLRTVHRKSLRVISVDSPQSSAREHDVAVDGALHERSQWASGVREAAGRVKASAWGNIGSRLNPPAALLNFTVVLIEPKFTNSLASVARACNCFECEDLRMVLPRVNPLAKRAMRGSCGGQHVLHRGVVCTSLAQALEGVEVAVAVTRWTSGCGIPAASVFSAAPALIAHIKSLDAQMLTPTPMAASNHSTSLELQKRARQATSKATPRGKASNDVGGRRTVPRRFERSTPVGWEEKNMPCWLVEPQQGDPSARTGRVALVFGREDAGFFQDELEQCQAAFSIRMGRLQESLSLSHAVAVLLAQLFQEIGSSELEAGKIHQELSPSEALADLPM